MAGLPGKKIIVKWISRDAVPKTATESVRVQLDFLALRACPRPNRLKSAQIASLPDQMEEESKSAHREGEEGGESTGQEPPVLPMDSTAAGSASGGGGLREQTDVWQVSTLPEHKTFFSLDVSRACFLT